MTNFISEFIDRGYLYQCTNLELLKEKAGKEVIAAYIGFDITAPSLHVGHLTQIMILRLLQQSGHKPIILVGGATTKIGDPTGKDEMRKVLTDEQLNTNMEGIKKCLAKFINFGKGKNDAVIVNNADWLEKIGYIEFLRDYGKYFSVNRMLGMDSVKNRLDRQQNLTFLEFNYSLLQAFDFYHLNKNHDCTLQIGGSDQWGNIISGVDFIRRLKDDPSHKEVIGLTTPLLTTSSGVKMGKTVGGAVWIDENQCSPYEYFQFWRNTEDPDVIKFAKLYTEYPEAQMQEFIALTHKDINQAKKQLAHHLTALCHGKEAADEARESARQIFELGGLTSALPEITINKEELESGVKIIHLLVRAELATSNSEARKLIRGGGAKLNDNKITEEDLLLNTAHFKDNKLKLSAGKKKHAMIVLT